ncbi:Uma2 family endonuclease [Microcoleus sp. FACHB-68]|uniref:Uma2 family endonuclease n=1 Tax=Microcoleus sp. FACHB-68 TaxID=2692826 RepID=UPI0016864B4A|nr:Uma2 family endonuclease [Microcoleus sp. FACHB-68]MBD1935879.1 Uma2 family endonuclease [Microcoleus sp. FACHB-68]
MIANQESFYISHQNYLNGEEISPIRHEYIRGEIWAMAGGTQAHNTIALNLASLLRNQVRGTGCRAFVENMKVFVETADVYYYPDVTVTCDERDRNASDSFIRYPTLVVEVLSEKTEAFDRGDKFADYRQIETLQEYVLINQNRQRVERFRRNAEGRWELYIYEKGEEVYLASVDFSMPVAAFYEDVPV